MESEAIGLTGAAFRAGQSVRCSGGSAACSLGIRTESGWKLESEARVLSGAAPHRVAGLAGPLHGKVAFHHDVGHSLQSERTTGPHPDCEMSFNYPSHHPPRRCDLHTLTADVDFVTLHLSLSLLSCLSGLERDTISRLCGESHCPLD